MYLSRLRLNRSREAVLWSANPYRVHQRLRLAFPNDPRLLFRIESSRDGLVQILVQSQTEPNWSAFDDLPVLTAKPDHKTFELHLTAGRHYQFRLLANPTVKRANKRFSLFKAEEQEAWLARKLSDSGAELVSASAAPQGLQRSRKSAHKDNGMQTHFAVLFDGLLAVQDPERLADALRSGIGSAKGYGFGLLSLAAA